MQDQRTNRLAADTAPVLQFRGSYHGATKGMPPCTIREPRPEAVRCSGLLEQKSMVYLVYVSYRLSQESAVATAVLDVP